MRKENVSLEVKKGHWDTLDITSSGKVSCNVGQIRAVINLVECCSHHEHHVLLDLSWINSITIWLLYPIKIVSWSNLIDQIDPFNATILPNISRLCLESCSVVKVATLQVYAPPVWMLGLSTRTTCSTRYPSSRLPFLKL